LIFLGIWDTSQYYKGKTLTFQALHLHPCRRAGSISKEDVEEKKNIFFLHSLLQETHPSSHRVRVHNRKWETKAFSMIGMEWNGMQTQARIWLKGRNGERGRNKEVDEEKTSPAQQEETEARGDSRGTFLWICLFPLCCR